MKGKKIFIGIAVVSVAFATYNKVTYINELVITERPVNDFLINEIITDSPTDFISNSDLIMYDISYEIEKEEKARLEKIKKEQEALKKSVQGKYPYTPPTNDLFRLAEHNDSKETIIDKINKFIKGSPIDNHGEYIYNVGVAYNLDPYFIVAVANQESSLGRHTTSVAKYNMFGIKSSSSPNGWRQFESREEALTYFAYLISKHYLDGRGFTTIEQIGETYCPAQGWPPAIRRNLKSIMN